MLKATLIFLITTASCAKDEQPIHKVDGSTKRIAYAADPYSLDLQLVPVEEDVYQFVAAMELESGSYFVSPYSSESYKGYFQVILKDNDLIHLSSDFIESPRSVAKPDKWQGGLSHFIEENTSYSYALKVNTTEDFKVTGMVQFVIEPQCTLEEIPFSISSKNGKLTVQKYPKLDKTTCTKKN